MRLIKDLGMQYTSDNHKYKTRYGIYECPFCLNHFKTSTRCINYGTTKSCGCVRKENAAKSVIKHGDYKSRLYNIFMQIKARCYQVNSPHYKNYGKRGIIVCDEWKNNYSIFKKWALYNGYSDSLTIDRINNDGNYEPSNCRWVTRCQQSENTRLLKSNNTSGYRGVTPCTTSGKWQSIIKSKKKRFYLGRFNSQIEAALAYNKFVIEHGTKHPLNIIPNVRISVPV